MFKYSFIAVTCFALFTLSSYTIRNGRLRRTTTHPRSLRILSASASEQYTFHGQFGIEQMSHSLYPDDVRVPADMWRHPTETWQPVELPNCIADPRARESTATHMSKFTTPFTLDDNLLRYYGPGVGLTPTDLKVALAAIGGDLILIGDSLMRQWFEQLSCYLGAWESWSGFVKPPIDQNRIGLEADITEAFMRFRPDWRKRGHLGVDIGRAKISQFGSFEFSTYPGIATNQRVIYQGVKHMDISDIADLLNFYIGSYPHVFGRTSPVIVINVGIKYHLINEGHHKSVGEIAYRDDLRILAKICRDSNARCIFRETTPQHFDTPAGDGLYTEKKYRCMSDIPESFSTLSDWRNYVLRDVMKENASGRNNFLTVMPIFKSMVGLNKAHHNSDCTKFLSNPEFWEPWHLSLTNALMDKISKASA